MTVQIITTLGNAKGPNDATAKQPQAASIPRVYGRVWVTPKILFARTRTTGAGSPYLWASEIGNDRMRMGDYVDCIWGVSQSGVSFQGVRYNGRTAGLRKNSAGSWVAADGGTVWYGFQALGGYTPATINYNSSNPTVQSLSSRTYANIQAIYSTSSPWGKEIAHGTSIPCNASGIPNVATWSNLTGGTTAPAWAYLVGTEAEGLTYANISTLRFEAMNIREDGRLPSFEVLVDGVGGGPDCSPSAAIRDILVNLLGVPDANVITATGPDGTATTSYDNYAASMASTFAINCAVDGDPKSVLNDLLQVTNAELVQLPGGVIRIQPIADAAVGTYAPASSAYSIGTSDIDPDGLEVEQRPDDECFNSVTVTYSDPSVGDTQYTHRDDFDIATYGIKRGSDVSSKWITSSAHARFVAEGAVRQSLMIRRLWRFTLSARYCLLEQGDLLSVSDAVLPVSSVRVTRVDGDEKLRIKIEATEWPGSVTPIDLTPESLLSSVESGQSLSDVQASLLTQFSAGGGTGTTAGDVSAAVNDGTTGLATKAQTTMSNVTGDTMLNQAKFGNYSAAKQINRSVLASITSQLAILGTTRGVGRWLAMDSSGVYCLAQGMQSDKYLWLNGAELTASNAAWQPYGDGVWRPDVSRFVCCSGANAGAMHITTGGTISTGGSAGMLCLDADPTGGVVFGRDILTANYQYCAGGSTSISISGTLAASAYWQSVRALYNAAGTFSGWLIVGQDANSRAVAIYLDAVGNSGTVQTLPNNANGLVTGGRTADNTQCSGIVAGCVDGVAFVMCAGKVWTATVTGVNSISAWTDQGSPLNAADGTSLGITPGRVKCTKDFALMLPNPLTEVCYLSPDGVNWQEVMVSGGFGTSVRAIGVSTRASGAKAQFIVGRGGTTGNIYVIGSGIANETLD